jgi:hypothetical protein
MDGTSRIIANWRSQGFDDFRAKTRAELRVFLEVVSITKDSIEYMQNTRKIGTSLEKHITSSSWKDLGDFCSVGLFKYFHDEF